MKQPSKLTARLNAGASRHFDHLETVAGPTIPLRDLLATSIHEQGLLAQQLMSLSKVLSPAFPLTPIYTGGTTAAAAGTSVGANAILERHILALRQDNEALAAIIAALTEYLGEV